MNIKNKLKIVNLSDIRPYPNNVKKHSEAQISQLCESFDKYDYYQPICVDDKNVIVVGHGRYLAAMQQDPAQKIEVVDMSYISAKERKRLRILDNKIISNVWDHKALLEEVDSLSSELQDIDSIAKGLNITESEMHKLIDESNEERPEGERTKQAYSLQARKFLKAACEACTDTVELEAHHMDQDRSNNDEGNIQTLCSKCHDFWHRLGKRIERHPIGRMPVLVAA